MLTRAQAELLYHHFGHIAAEIAEEGAEVQPQIFFIHMNGESFDYSVLDPKTVALLHSHSLGKDVLATLIKATLAGEGTLAGKLPKPVDAVVHITEGWMVVRDQPGGVIPSECPDRAETLLITIHSPDRSRVGMSMITANGPKGRHIDLAPMPGDSEGVYAGRFVLGSEQQQQQMN